MISISKPLTPGTVKQYFREEYSAARHSYFTEGQEIRGQWHGNLVSTFGLFGMPVTEEAFTRLSDGQDPRTGEALIKWRAAAEQDYAAFLDADLSFHAALGALSGFDGVTRLATTARAHLDRVRALSLPEKHMVESRIKDHEAILETLRAGDLKTADALLTAHLRSVLEVLPLMRARHPDYFAPEGDGQPNRPGISITLETPSR